METPVSDMRPGANQEDRSLVALARTGDQQAFRTLVERYEGAVAATVIGMMGPGADADDVGQEVFVRFYRSLARFRGDATLKTYLTRIAINLSLNALKRRRRLLDRFINRDRSADEAPLPEPAMSGDLAMASDDLTGAVQEAIRSLGAEHRAVVVLRMIEGYSTRETAELLRVPQGTVMSRLSRAMRTLEPMLRPWAEHLDD